MPHARTREWLSCPHKTAYHAEFNDRLSRGPFYSSRPRINRIVNRGTASRLAREICNWLRTGAISTTYAVVTRVLADISSRHTRITVFSLSLRIRPRRGTVAYTRPSCSIDPLPWIFHVHVLSLFALSRGRLRFLLAERVGAVVFYSLRWTDVALFGHFLMLLGISSFHARFYDSFLILLLFLFCDTCLFDSWWGAKWSWLVVILYFILFDFSFLYALLSCSKLESVFRFPWSIFFAKRTFLVSVFLFLYFLLSLCFNFFPEPSLLFFPPFLFIRDPCTSPCCILA